jgi:hypothetical protein
MDLLRNKLAYEASKLLNFSGWKGLLPRNITPSDTDMMIANEDKFLFVELKSNADTFAAIPKGQARLFADLVKMGKGKVFAAVAKHKIKEPGEYINTVTDIEGFQFLWWTEEGLDYSPVMPGKIWAKSVRTLLFGGEE